MPPALKDLRIVFMGTPEFAVASLDALLQAGMHVVGVVTAPDKPAGRGMKLQQSAVKKFAEEKGLRILQPPKLKDPEFLEELKSLNAHVQVVVAFRMLPEVVWNMPPMGTINVHASLLPDYRGAAPINWAIINGEKQTGVTTFKLQHEIDTGNILLQEAVEIGTDETAGDLHDKLKDTGAALLVKTIHGLLSGAVTEQPQENLLQNREPIHAPKIFTPTCEIDWNKPAVDIYNLIRGLSPYPAAYTHLHGKLLKIYKAEIISGGHASPPGTTFSDGKSYLHYQASDSIISVQELQLEGKRKMKVDEFLRGYRFPENQ